MKGSYIGLARQQGVEKYHTFPGKGSKYFVNNRSTIPCLSDWYYLDKSNFFLKKCIHLLSNRENTRDPSNDQPQCLDHIIFSKSGWTWLFFFHGFVWERDKSLHTHCIIGEQWKNYSLRDTQQWLVHRNFKIPLGWYPKLPLLAWEMFSEWALICSLREAPSLMFFMGFVSNPCKVPPFP